MAQSVAELRTRARNLATSAVKYGCKSTRVFWAEVRSGLEGESDLTPLDWVYAAECVEEEYRIAAATRHEYDAMYGYDGW